MNLSKKNKFIIASFAFITIFLASGIMNGQKTGNKEVVKISNFFEHDNYTLAKKFFLNQLNSPYENINYVIKKNDTLEKILRKLKIENKKINTIIEIIKKVTNPNTLIKGNEINIILQKTSIERNQLQNESKLSDLTLVEYIKTSIEILMNMKKDEFINH